MTTQYVSGDLFDNTHEAQAFAHGCNCQGSMGAGIAKTFRTSGVQPGELLALES